MITNEQKMLKERVQHLFEDKKLKISMMARSESDRVMLGRQIFGKETSVSFQTLYRLLYMYQDIDANWLVMGEGSMYKADHIAPRIYNQHNEVHSNTAGGDINVGPDTIVTKKTVDSLEATIAAQKKRIHELEAINTTLQNVINSTFAPRI